MVPSTADGEHYMLSARLPPHSSKDDFQGMMQRLLKERFGLSYRTVYKKMTGYTLKVAKGGAKLRASPATPAIKDSANEPDLSGPRRVGPDDLKIGKDGFPILPEGLGLSVVSMNGSTRLRSNGETMAGFAGILSDQIHEPVVNGTGLSGWYDITVTWTSDAAGLPKSPELFQWPPLDVALASQLSLKLEKGRENVRVLVVTHTKRTPAVE